MNMTPTKNTSGAYDLTVIVPVYNEEEALPRFKKEMDAFIEASTKRVFILFVNDGSKDDSLSIIKEIAKNNEAYGYISLAANRGLSTAIKAGIDYARTPLVGYIDSDLQTTPMDFVNYYEYLGDFAMVNGIRAARHDSFIKKISSKIANGFRRLMINDQIADTCCPLKIIDSEYAKKIPFFNGMHRFMPALVQLQGGKVKQIEVKHFERKEGQAKYHLFNRLVGPFFDTLAFMWIKRRYINYAVSEEENIKDSNKSTEHNA